MQQPRIKFPYGISNFEKLVTQDYRFVDKTHFIELLEKEENYSVFLRPRRMGKSLFVSILEYYYDIREKDKFDKLFSKYYIGQHPTPKANAYRVLKFDFSGIDSQTAESSYRGFLLSIRFTISTFMERHGLFEAEDREFIIAQKTPGELMKAFFKYWKERTQDNIPIYLLIDEYDHFTNEILIRDLSEFKKSVSQDGYVRKFYESIKIATQQGFIDRFFITGVSPITMDGLTSGFNMVKHLTTDERFFDMVGFREDEVSVLLDLVLEDKSRKPSIMEDLKKWYNGYGFSPESTETVYNSDMVLYFFGHFKIKQLYPRQMLDPNIMPDYGKLMQLFQIANIQENIEVLETVLQDGYISCDLIYQFFFEKPFDKTSFINLLYYLGNLTIGGIEPATGYPKFVIPNYVIERLYWQYYAMVLQEQADLGYNTSIIQEAVVGAAKGNISLLFQLLQKVLEGLSNRDFQRFDEKYIKCVLMSYLHHAPFYFLRSEREVTNDGYLDLEVLQHPDNLSSPQQYVIELKYLKQSEAEQLDATMDSAKAQLQSYLEVDEILQHTPRLKAIAVVVVKDQVYFEEC